MTTQTDTRIASGRVERIANSGKSFYINGGHMFTMSSFSQQTELPPVGATVSIEYQPKQTNDGQRTIYWVNRWDFDMSASIDGPVRQLENAPQNANGAPLLQAQGLRDDKPVVTRLACLNAAIATMAKVHTSDGETLASIKEAVLGLAEKYVAWALYGGAGSKAEKDPPASEVLYNPEFNPYE